MEKLIIYRIRHNKIGLYSRGGCSVHDNPYMVNKKKEPVYSYWSKKGKLWQGLGGLKNHLSQYIGKGAYLDSNGNMVNPGQGKYNNNYIYKNDIPEDWIVEEFDLNERTSKEYPARSLYPEKGLIKRK
jgi:hypothetical protein